MNWDVNTIISIVTGIINLVLLTFLVNFFKTFREIAKEREELIKEQKNLSDSKTQVVEKELAFADRQNRHLVQDKEKLQMQLTNFLKAGGINRDFLPDNSFLQNLTTDFKKRVEDLTKQLENVQEVIKSNNLSDNTDYEYHLSIGNGFVVNKKWEKAAHHLEIASFNYPNDWNLYLVIGICYANMRNGKSTDAKSIEAYTKAIIHLPESNSDIKGKIYIYRGAMLKRMNKLEEAEHDINFGLARVKSRHFELDGIYNLACIYAMRNERGNLLKILGEVKPANTFMNSTIKRHLNDYFYNFSKDKEFLELIS